MLRFRLAGVALLLLAVSARAQTRSHVIQGRVTSDSGRVVGGADVIVTIAPSAEVVVGKTDSAGDYRIAIVNATGEYILNVSMLGFRAFRQRVTIPASDSVATVNARLITNVQTLAAVQVQARRPRPARSAQADNGLGTDATNRTVDGVLNALSPDMRGNLEAMAALVPGLSVTGSGVSAFGLAPDANMTTLNGMQFSGGSVPRDLALTTSFITSPWDPRYGGFSGALQNSTLRNGANVSTRRSSVSFDNPSMQVSDPIAARAGQKFTNFLLSGAASGALSLDKYFYNIGAQGSRRTADVRSLLDLDQDALIHAGISPDSAFRLTQILAAQGIPLSASGVASQRTTSSGSFLGRFDRLLPSAGPAAIPKPTFNLLFGANVSQTKSGSVTPTSLPVASGKTTDMNVMMQGLYSRFLGKNGDYVNETSANVSFARTSGAPYLQLPTGSVLVAGAVGANGVPAIGNLGFGGNSALSRESRTLTWEIDNQTNFLVRGHSSLPATLFLQSRFEHYDQALAANRLGTFSFASLADLEAHRPSSFSRTLNVPDRSGGQWLGAASLGGQYSKPKILLTGGARLDANVFTGAPVANPAIEQAFSTRNDRAPNSIDVSPRVGFNWYYTARGGASISVFGGTGTFMRGGPQIRGGIGKFRSYLPSTLLADAIGNTGLPGSTQRLVCTGPASPNPDWTEFASNPSSIPVACTGGESVFADAAPAASLVDPSYRPSTAWRTGLGWTSTIRNNYIAIDGLYSLNTNQPGTVDLNFAGTSRFTLDDEGGRPVFVAPTSIVPATGGLSSVESRQAAAFGRVTNRVSDLRGDARQVTVYSIPNIPYRYFGIWTLGYTWSDARVQARGFDQTTDGDPRRIEWATSPFTPRHQFIIQAGRGLFAGRAGLTMLFRAMSGLRYTPLVAGDINGDGSFNDRAFVANAASGDDGDVSRGLRELLANGSSSARECLRSQLGKIAARNSCVGPWSATMNANLSLGRLPGTNNRLTMSINFANPLGGLDLLLHGNEKLRGWGAAPLIDGTLYQVRGFDPVAKRFQYSVNPRFGATNPSVTTLRAPFRMTLDFSLDLGPNRAEQQLVLFMREKPALIGTRASYDTLKARYLSRQSTEGFMDIYRVMLRYADSLALSRDQAEKVQERQRFLAARADSLYGELAKYLVALPKDFSPRGAVKRATDAANDMWAIIYAEGPWIKNLLTPGQVRLLPAGMREMVTMPKYRGRFFYSY